MSVLVRVFFIVFVHTYLFNFCSEGLLYKFTTTRVHRTAALALLACALMAMSRAAAAPAGLKIGCIGVGMVGGPLSAEWSAAGHSVFGLRSILNA